MELHEKSAFAQEKPFYNAIPLITLDKGQNNKIRVDPEDLRYRVASPRWMKFRLLLFWMLWAILVMAIMLSVLAQFWQIFVPRTHHNRNMRENMHENMRENMRENINLTKRLQ